MRMMVFPSSHAGPALPQQPTNLMNVDTRVLSTMIQWTVPIIAYTPETYVVNYGTSMSSLNVMSDPVQSGSDFEAVDQVFSVELTGLVDTTTYYYQVVATNGQGSTSSVIQSFTTTILRKLYGYDASSITTMYDWQSRDIKILNHYLGVAYLLIS